jgi:hypothetical protein
MLERFEEGSLQVEILLRDKNFLKIWNKYYGIYQQLTKEIAEDNDIFVCDAAALFSHKDTSVLFWDEVHRTDLGNEVLAGIIGDFILKHGMIKQ